MVPSPRTRNATGREEERMASNGQPRRRCAPTTSQAPANITSPPLTKARSSWGGLDCLQFDSRPLLTYEATRIQRGPLYPTARTGSLHVCLVGLFPLLLDIGPKEPDQIVHVRQRYGRRRDGSTEQRVRQVRT